MDKIIKAANFQHTDSDLQYQLNDQLEKWRQTEGDHVTLPAILAALKVTQEKVCRPEFPSESSSGYWSGYYVFQCLTHKISDLIDQKKAKPSDFHEPYLDFVICLIQAGPNSSHIEFAFLLFKDSNVDLKSYVQSLQGKNISKVLNVLKKNYTPDPGMEWGTFGDKLTNFIRYLLSSVFTSEQFKEEHSEFLELFMHFNTAYTKPELEDLRKTMSKVSIWISLKYDRNPFKGTNDANLIKRHLATVSKLILAPEYPESKDGAETMDSLLLHLLRAVSDENLIGATHGEIMDLSLNITVKKAGCEGTKKHFETIGYFFFHINEAGVKNNEELYEKLIAKFIHFLNNVKDETYLALRFAEPVVYDCLLKAMSVSKAHVTQWLEMIVALLKHHTAQCLKAAYRALREQQKAIKWKEYPEKVKEILTLLSKVTIPDWLTSEDRKTAFECLRDIASDFLENIKKVNMHKDLQEDLLQFVFRCMEMRTPDFYKVGAGIASKAEFNVKKNKALIMEIIRRVSAMLADTSYNWDEETTRELSSTVRDLVQRALSGVKDGKSFTKDELDEIVKLAKQCQDFDYTSNELYTSVNYLLYVTIGPTVISWLYTMNEQQRGSSLVPGIIAMLEANNDNLNSICGSNLTILSMAGGVCAPYMEKLIDLFLENEQPEILGAIVNSYEKNPGPMAAHFQEIFQHADSGNAGVRSYMQQLVQKVAKYQPDLFTEENIQVILNEAKGDSIGFQTMILMSLEELAKRRPEKMKPFVDQIINHTQWQPAGVQFVNRILQFVALHSEADAHRILQFLMNQLRTQTEKYATMSALSAARLIGFKHRQVLAQYRPAIEKLRAETSDDDLHNYCTSILDMLDGKSLDKIADELKVLQDDVADLDIRMVTTEKNVAEVKVSVKEQGQDIQNVKNEVTVQGQRLDKVEVTVEETVVKVEEIDSKTLSHAPYWSRDVSKLLNPETDHDWRLLSSRLGYSKDDVRGWAQQSDPCMAMLNEWYATHKTREATHAILTALQDMAREDAAAIVENAMKSAESVVEDDDFEYSKPPDVFLSYQWGHQNEVLLLRQHLEMAGYSCWMDVGQMGGGDKLFEKIDAGIRGAKVVISCVSEKYAKSPNCNREVNLSVSLGKPIIPLLMEKLSWPPPGSMGPIFSEYLFIRFFQRPGEETKDQRFWPLAMFQQLLMQLSMNGITPDENSVQSEYKDWWMPQVQEIKVDKNREKGGTSNSTTATISLNNEKAAVSPDIFISYQWDKQPQIVRLFRTLTSLGYTCWLDIMQMGGGDSLYDKIDRGLRGCRVVVSCVTPKYALSANCRREVSLADALKKPLIPILLESMSWPPQGPMGPVLTQLLYIDFASNPKIQDSWTGQKFDELLAQINQSIPQMTDTSAAGSSPPPPPQKMQPPAADVVQHTKTESPKTTESTKTTESPKKTESPKTTESPKKTITASPQSPASESTPKSPPTNGQASKSCQIL